MGERVVAIVTQAEDSDGRVDVKVVGIDRDRQRISLSLKRLAADPLVELADRLETGQTMDATITRVMPYGAFARIAEGVEGLIHVSEFSAERAEDLDALVHLSLSARLAERT